MNDAFELRAGMQEKVNHLNASQHELMHRAEQFDKQKLIDAYNTKLWQQDAKTFADEQPLEAEIAYIRDLSLSGVFTDMDHFHESLQSGLLLEHSHNALIEKNTEKAASLISYYPFVNFTENARAALKACIIDLLDTNSIKELPPATMNKIISFHAENGKVVDYIFTRDLRTKVEEQDLPQALLWQASEFHAQLFHALIQLSHCPELTFNKVTTKTELNTRSLSGVIGEDASNALAHMLNLLSNFDDEE